MGAQRKRAFAPLTGTTAERVSARAGCPVLIVRSQGTLRYDRVVVAADLTPRFKDVLRTADRWSFFDRAPVSIVHGFQSPYQGPLFAEGYDLRAARQYIARWKKVARVYLLGIVSAAGLNASRFDLRIEEKRPLRVVRRALRYGASSLLVLGATERNVVSRAFRASLANDALLSLNCDVLICRRDEPRGLLH
jgi:nucleotide-binding universal stress UspA family protein